MLYITTRNNTDPCTPLHVLQESRGSDGGLYLPFRLPRLSAEELQKLAQKSFNQCVADVLNLFFSTKISAWDIDYCIGRYPVRLQPLRNRIVIAETWHNPDWQYERLVKSIAQLLSAAIDSSGSWIPVAVQIAVLFGILGEKDIHGSDAVDIAVVSEDFTAPVAAWMARKMGLPIGNIICCCNENKNPWDLFSLGQMKTDGVSLSTNVPEADIAVPLNLERFIFACGGIEENRRYLQSYRSGLVYEPGAEQLSRMRQGMFVSVVSSGRVEATIPNVYKTHSYLMTPGAALAYSGLMDYRAKTGSTRTAVVLSKESPVCHKHAVAMAMGMTDKEIEEMI